MNCTYAKFRGVYILLLGGQVQYIGASVDVVVRVRCHMAEGKIQFDEVRYADVPESQMFQVEKALITELEPPFNISHTKRAKLFRRKRIGNRQKKLRINLSMSSKVHEMGKKLADMEHRNFSSFCGELILAEESRLKAA